MEQDGKWQEDAASIAQYLQKVPKRSREEAKSSFQEGTQAGWLLPVPSLLALSLQSLM